MRRGSRAELSYTPSRRAATCSPKGRPTSSVPRLWSNEPPSTVSVPTRDHGRLAPHLIDDATAAATTEDHRVGALERLDALDVVEIAQVLRVVAHAVDEEVGGRALAADHRRVAMALALRHRDTGDEAHDVGHALHRLVGDDGAREHRRRLRRVAQRRVRLRRRPGAGHGVRRPPGALRDDLHPGQLPSARRGALRAVRSVRIHSRFASSRSESPAAHRLTARRARAATGRRGCGPTNERIIGSIFVWITDTSLGTGTRCPAESAKHIEGV